MPSSDIHFSIKKSFLSIIMEPSYQRIYIPAHNHLQVTITCEREIELRSRETRKWSCSDLWTFFLTTPETAEKISQTKYCELTWPAPSWLDSSVGIAEVLGEPRPLSGSLILPPPRARGDERPWVRGRSWDWIQFRPEFFFRLFHNCFISWLSYLLEIARAVNYRPHGFFRWFSASRHSK